MDSIQAQKYANLKKESILRARARLDFKSFVLLKWERYNKSHFLDNWHYDFICKVLESTLPNPPQLNPAQPNPALDC